MLKTGPGGRYLLDVYGDTDQLNFGRVGARTQSDEIPTMFELVFFRNLIALVVLVPIVMPPGRRSARPVSQMSRYMDPAGPFSRITAMVFLFYALARMPIADVYALQYTIPLFTILLAVVVLKQKADMHSWIGLFCRLCRGTLIVMRPGIIEITLASAWLRWRPRSCHAGSNTTIKLLAKP